MENNNSVCYVGRVTEVKAIEGADNIESVHNVSDETIEKMRNRFNIKL